MPRFQFASVACAALVATSSAVSASSVLPVEWAVEDGGNGHYYLFVDNEYYIHTRARALDHEDAAASANTLSYLGMTGYLVTIADAAEQAFVRSLASAAAAWGPTSIMIGASDAESEGEWIWEGGPDEGVALSDGYSNWETGVPASWMSWADYVSMKVDGTWFANDGYAMPYVVEFSLDETSPVPLPATGLLMASVIGGAGFAGWRARRRSALE